MLRVVSYCWTGIEQAHSQAKRLCSRIRGKLDSRRT